jgi:signal transduction histidine kinase
VFTGVRARLNGQTTLVGMGVDISEQKRREAQLREAKQEAEKARAEAEEAARLKAAMLANMSHEVRTPLTSVIGFAEVLVGELDGQSEAFAENILQSSQRLMQTLDSVLQLSKLDAGEYDTAPEPLDLAAVTEDEVSNLRSQVDRPGDTLDLRCDLPDESLQGRWDETSLRRILRNLLHNAVKFTSGEGRVTARVRADGDAAVVEIEDTGVGMSDAFRQEAFQAFRQESRGTNRAFEGTGLGLAITQRLVDRLGGSIRIDSEKGEGTRVTVRLAREK